LPNGVRPRPTEGSTNERIGTLIAEQRPRLRGSVIQLGFVIAQVSTGGERRVVDAVGTGLAVTVAVSTDPRPDQRYDLHRPDGAVVAGVAVQAAVVGVDDLGEPGPTVQPWAEDRALRGAGRIQLAAVIGDHLAQSRHERPLQPAVRHLVHEDRLSTPIGVEGHRRDAQRTGRDCRLQTGIELARCGDRGHQVRTQPSGLRQHPGGTQPLKVSQGAGVPGFDGNAARAGDGCEADVAPPK